MTMAWEMPLNSTEAIVLLALADCANDEGFCYPGYESLMRKTKLSKSTLAKTLAILEGAGLFKKKSHAAIGEGKKVNTYEMLFDDSWFSVVRNSKNPKRSRSELIESTRIELIEKIKELRSEKKRPISSHLEPRKVHTSNSKSSHLEHEPSVITVSKEPSVLKDVRAKKNDDEAKKNTKLTEDEALLLDYGIEGQLAKDFIKHRKSKRAQITQTAMSGLAREAAKAGITNAEAVALIIEANWQGFNADWYFNRQQKSPASATNRKPGFQKQPMQRPDYSALWEGGDAIDSTAMRITDEPARL